jgi:hypothetical protein
MKCGGWWCWEGWTAVGSIAGVLSLLTLGFAIYEILIQRKRIRPVVWGFDLFGVMTKGEDSFHLAELHNGGTGTASITTLAFVGARPVPNAEHRFHSVIGPGESAVIPLSAPRIADAWFVVVWTEDSDATLSHIEWLYVAGIGTAVEKWRTSVDRTRALGRFRDFPRGQRARPVGPGYFQYSSFRWSRNPRVADARFATTWSAMAAVGKTMFPWSYTATAAVTDLPYVPHSAAASTSVPGDV